MVFTQEEIANMGKEVDEDMSDLEDDFLDEDEDEDEENLRKREHSSSSDENEAVYGC